MVEELLAPAALPCWVHYQGLPTTFACRAGGQSSFGVFAGRLSWGFHGAVLGGEGEGLDLVIEVVSGEGGVQVCRSRAGRVVWDG